MLGTMLKENASQPNYTYSKVFEAKLYMWTGFLWQIILTESDFGEENTDECESFLHGSQLQDVCYSHKKGAEPDWYYSLLYFYSNQTILL